MGGVSGQGACMFLDREFQAWTEDPQWSVLSPTITQKNRAVDIFNFYDWLPRSPIAFVLLSDGFRWAIAQAPKSEIPNLSVPDLVRFGTISFTGVTSDLPHFTSPAVRNFIEQVNGHHLLLVGTKITFKGRGPVFTRLKAPQFVNQERQSQTLEDFQEDSDDMPVIPKKFMCERPNQFKRVDSDCIIM